MAAIIVVFLNPESFAFYVERFNANDQEQPPTSSPMRNPGRGSAAIYLFSSVPIRTSRKSITSDGGRFGSISEDSRRVCAYRVLTPVSHAGAYNTLIVPSATICLRVAGP